MSESGNRVGVNSQSLLAECIGQVEQTQGTETSKYLEEKKTIVIPQVVASEKGIAQILTACCQEVVGPHLENNLKLNLLES